MPACLRPSFYGEAGVSEVTQGRYEGNRSPQIMSTSCSLKCKNVVLAVHLHQVVANLYALLRVQQQDAALTLYSMSSYAYLKI